jgi:hypothetical protein
MHVVASCTLHAQHDTGQWFTSPILHAAYGRGLVACEKGEVRPWIAMQLLGCSLESLIGGHVLRKRSTFFRFANQMLTVSRLRFIGMQVRC